MRLYLIRHPAPLVAPGLCYGSTDLAVLPAQQERVAAQLAKVLPLGLVLYSSPLQRCAGLAQALAQRLGGGPVRYDARLAELDFGQWEIVGYIFNLTIRLINSAADAHRPMRLVPQFCSKAPTAAAPRRR